MKPVLAILKMAFLAMSLAVAGLIGMSAPVLAANPSYHDKHPIDPNNYRVCKKCHFDWQVNKQGTSAWGVDEHKGFTSRRNRQEMLCVECHSAVAIASHPTGFSPTRSLPKEFPLNARGQMTCTTCHDIQKAGKPELQARETGEGFCLSCHSASFFAGMVDAGSSIMNSGHVSAENDTRGSVDNYSLQCMTCHPDQAAVSGGKTASKNFMLASGGTSHPIGTNYQTMARYSGYRLSYSLPEEIILPNGQVSCISCHIAYTKDHGEPVLKDNLCTTCHDK